jgi:hypothetical protein
MLRLSWLAAIIGMCLGSKAFDRSRSYTSPTVAQLLVTLQRTIFLTDQAKGV